jgi:hypothetical protein
LLAGTADAEEVFDKINVALTSTANDTFNFLLTISPIGKRSS